MPTNKTIIHLPQNPYTETGITGGDLSRAFYEALNGVIKLNTDCLFTMPPSRQQEQQDSDKTRVDWDLIQSRLGRPVLIPLAKS